MGLPLHPWAAPSGPPPQAQLGEDFGGAAARLAGFAAVALGWSPDAFWRATPAELAGVVAVLAGDAATALDQRGVAALMEAFPDG
ncbi:phage tail assembly chaperone [Sphingomonas sp.]|uniref:phage tail assembly chaperone n=1 Tax=Sphingomonas sp. TaxID=28214 RepID=UPI0039C94574